MNEFVRKIRMIESNIKINKSQLKSIARQLDKAIETNTSDWRIKQLKGILETIKKEIDDNQTELDRLRNSLT